MGLGVIILRGWWELGDAIYGDWCIESFYAGCSMNRWFSIGRQMSGKRMGITVGGSWDNLCIGECYGGCKSLETRRGNHVTAVLVGCESWLVVIYPRAHNSRVVVGPDKREFPKMHLIFLHWAHLIMIKTGIPNQKCILRRTSNNGVLL